MANDLSRKALLGFLDYVGAKGLMNKATLSARKAAANKVLGILSEDEAADVTALNVDQLMHRFSNLQGSNYTPESMSAYKSRLKAAIDDFASYQGNPLAFRPSVSNSARKPKERSKATDTDKTDVHGGPVGMESVPQAPRPTVANSIMPIPIRPDLTIYVQGLPYDLTKAEANKIASVVKAMAGTDEG